MQKDPEKSSVVTLINSLGDEPARVAVGVRVTRGTVVEKPSFSVEYFESNSSLHGDIGSSKLYRSTEELKLACELSVANALHSFRKQHDEPLNCVITLIKGENLLDNCTVGFALATLIAVSRAIGSSSQATEEMHGWKEVD